MTGRAGGVVLLGALTILWGGNWPAMKAALRELDPWTFRTICLLVGGGGLLLMIRGSGRSLAVPRSERWPLAVVAFFNITTWHLLSAYGLTLIRAGRAAIIAYTMPLWTVIFGFVLLGEGLTRTKVVALLLGFAGLAVLIGPEVGGLVAAPRGALFMLAAAACWALGTVLLKAFRWSTPTAVLTGWQLVLGAVPVALGALVLGTLPTPSALEPATLLGALYATFVGVIFCHWAWFKVVELLPAAVAAIGTLGIPVVGVLASAVVLGEPIGVAEILALVLVLAGLAVLVTGLGASGRGTRAGPPTSRNPDGGTARLSGRS